MTLFPGLTLALGFATLAVPVALLAWLASARPRGAVDAAARIGLVGGITVFLALAGPWSYLSHWLRPLLLVALAIAAWRCLRAPYRRRVRPVALVVTVLAGVAALGLTAAFVLSGLPPAPPRPLAFPLPPGAYAALQAGAGRLTNPFHEAAPGGALAIDLVALTPLGNRASVLWPERLEDYAIYGRPVLSPCAGTVAAAVDGRPDLAPGRVDRAYPAGNHLILLCAPDDLKVVLAHLRNGSIRVAAGDAVQAGQKLARVGNSGNTAEPHLHIQAWRGADGPADGTPVPVAFDGRFLTANSLVFR